MVPLGARTPLQLGCSTSDLANREGQQAPHTEFVEEEQLYEWAVKQFRSRSAECHCSHSWRVKHRIRSLLRAVSLQIKL